MSQSLPPFPPRPREAHKGSMGRVLLLAGSRGMAGAAALAAEAALRSGAGYVVVVAPGSIAVELTTLVPCAVLRLCGDRDRERLEAEDWAIIARELPRADALAVGPGWGLASGTGAILERLLDESSGEGARVFDADALNLLAEFGRQGTASPSLGGNTVLSPHPGEAARLLNRNGPGDVEQDRDAAIRALVQRFGAHVVLKGAPSLVAGPTQEAIWTNESGNPGMATAGCGDVLTGMLAGLLARGLSPSSAARLAVHLHGRAGDLAAAELSEEALIASDLLRFLPKAITEHLARSQDSCV